MRGFRRHATGWLVMLGLISLMACQNTPGGNPLATDAERSEESAASGEAQSTVSVSIPEGAMIQVRLVDALSSASSRSGDTFEAHLDAPLVVDNWVAVPKGARVLGRVTTARPSGHLKTPARLGVTLVALEVEGQMYDITTSRHVQSAKSHAKRNTAWIGGGAAGGALLGGLIGGKKGAAIGAGAGAGGGTATAYATGKKDIVLPAETPLRFTLQQPLTIVRRA
jgi:hypothetical protein